MAGGCTKPLIAYVAGRFVEDLPEGTVFGHVASIIMSGRGKPSTKIAHLRRAGALVADNFADNFGRIIPLLQQAMGRHAQALPLIFWQEGCRMLCPQLTAYGTGR